MNMREKEKKMRMKPTRRRHHQKKTTERTHFVIAFCGESKKKPLRFRSILLLLLIIRVFNDSIENFWGKR